MLTFDAATHTYAWNGEPVPGVTSVLAPLMHFEYVKPEVLAAKAALGSAVHVCCELDDLGDLDEASVAPEWAPYLAAYRRFKAEVPHEWANIETRVFHPKFRYAGTLDRAGLVFGRPAVLDLKCAAAIHPAVGPQTAAYVEAGKHTPDFFKARNYDRFSLQLRPDGTYRLDPHKSPGDFGLFTGLLAIHRWCAAHRQPAPNFIPTEKTK